MKYSNIKLTALTLAAVLTSPVCTAATGDIYNYEFTALGTTISSQIKAANKEKAQFCANVVKKRFYAWKTFCLPIGKIVISPDSGKATESG